jgi:serine/threonine-protein kinase HipA
MGFEDEIAILIERYDRFQIGARFQRVHQEYICQALALPPERKYDGEGGPGVRQVIELLKTFSTNSEEDI